MLLLLLFKSTSSHMVRKAGGDIQDNEYQGYDPAAKSQWNTFYCIPKTLDVFIRAFSSSNFFANHLIFHQCPLQLIKDIWSFSHLFPTALIHDAFFHIIWDKVVRCQSAVPSCNIPTRTCCYLEWHTSRILIRLCTIFKHLDVISFFI